jgi:hypothetical protein
MNKKILEIAEQVGIGFWGDKIIVLNPDEQGDVVLARFADAIINQCAEIANYMEDKEETDIGDAILDYFGVEYESH